MSTGTGGAERTLRQLLAPTCALSGAVVAAGFFFPSFVGSTVDGRGWLVISLLFFGSGLGYLAVLPGGTEEESNAAAYLLRVRRATLREAVGEFLARHDPVILGVPVATFTLFFALQFVAPSATVGAVNAVRDVLLRDTGPLFLGAMLLAVCYCAVLLVGPWGEIRLGGPDAEPAYTYPTYFTLVFTAGIAAGIVFWGPAEALFHYGTPPPYFGATHESAGAVGPALTYALFHWGVSAWSAYAVIGVPIAYFVFQRGAPLRVSTILAPFLGVDGLDSPAARLVDTLAVFATIGGIATSVALVGQQFLTGVGFTWGVETGSSGPLLFVGGLTLIYVLSATTGVNRGIRRIAGLNVALFGLFGLLLLAVGPRSFVAAQGTAALGSYLGNFVPMSLFLGDEWVASWTVWNWSWWFSWAPFAGLFLAALSRGMKIRTVVFTGVVATAAATMGWFLLMGGTSLFVQRRGAVDVLGRMAASEGAEAVAGFPVLAALPLGELLVFAFLALIVVFITSSADTSTLVVAVLSSERGLAPTPGSIAFWGGFQGVVAVSVLLLGGGETLQAMAVLTGGPFAVLSVVALAGLTLTFRREEGGHTSPVVRLWNKLPTIHGHHDVDPSKED
ncbi:BCCT family transporter [Halobaculum gomorrense]|uniref:Choline-glycine betaine transporter n=1 Tax=Halobaculum gomorrense TaxID=43928 RepID=A0A1M5PET1_9EURY|nr:BCCT family transporter [Halobaculum gomorrense]SHG99763.1 Choline-glycine betaine transporter [Halobaculum gomorrense]